MRITSKKSPEAKRVSHMRPHPVAVPTCAAAGAFHGVLQQHHRGLECTVLHSCHRRDGEGIMVLQISQVSKRFEEFGDVRGTESLVQILVQRCLECATVVMYIAELTFMGEELCLK